MGAGVEIHRDSVARVGQQFLRGIPCGCVRHEDLKVWIAERTTSRLASLERGPYQDRKLYPPLSV